MDTNQPSNKTELNDRTLWFDGASTYSAKVVEQKLQKLSSNRILFVDQLTNDIKQYNSLVPSDKQIRVKQDIDPLKFDWMIPDDYKNLNVGEYVIEQLHKHSEDSDWSDDEIIQRVVRVADEMKLYENHGLNDVLRVLIFIINTLNNESVVWGVGRGSSVSSYVLYLIGVHDVDSVKYELDIADFLH